MRIFIAAVCVTLFCACKKQVDCVPPGLRYHFKGFDSSELIIVRQLRYEPGSHFQKLVSERIASSSKKNHYSSADTLSLDYLSASQFHDEIILLPHAGGREFRIRNIIHGDETQSLPAFSAVEDHCYLSCSLYLNDSLIRFPGRPPTSQSTAPNSILLKK